jgi:hypothetical protein
MGNDVSLLDKWYRTDFNSVPPVSILQPIDTYLVHFLNKRVPKLQARDSGVWWGTLAKMQLVKCLEMNHLIGNLVPFRLHNFILRRTEASFRKQEVYFLVSSYLKPV